MKLYCCLCGRPTEPAVMIGQMAVGPVCARKANLLPLARRKGGMVFPVVRSRGSREKAPETLDLFAELEEQP
jgi:hypothetical protein